MKEREKKEYQENGGGTRHAKKVNKREIKDHTRAMEETGGQSL